MSAKEELLQVIKSLPDDVKLEEIVKRLRFHFEQRLFARMPPLEGEEKEQFIAKIKEGLADAEAGRFVDDEDLEREFPELFSSE